MAVLRPHLEILSIVTFVLLTSNIVFYMFYNIGVGSSLKDISDRSLFGNDPFEMTTLYAVRGAGNDERHTSTITSYPEGTTSQPIVTMPTSWNNHPSCQVKTDWNRYLSYPKVTTNITHWNFTDEITCDYKFNVTRGESLTQLSFACSDDFTKVKTFYKYVNRSKTNADIQAVNFGDKCLGRFIQSCCYDSFRVPNVVHYVRYGSAELRFFEFVSFISVIRFVKPCAILIHGDQLPKGDYWNDIRAIFPNIIHVKRKPPYIIGGVYRKYPTHSSDIMRLEALRLYGGTYIDADTLIVKPIDELRSFPCTMSAQIREVLSSSFISSEKNSTFINRWLDGYKTDYKPYDYIYNAMIYPQRLAANFSSEINVLNGGLSRPWGQAKLVVYKTNYRWESLYGMHLYQRQFFEYNDVVLDVENIKRFNCTVGSMCRHILYGNKELCRG